MQPERGTGTGKGRPTPKRSEAEAARRQRAKPPASRREAAKRMREDARAERLRRRQALVSGDERYLPARDKGPVRAFVRDFIDARRSVAEFFIVVALAVLVLSVVAPPLGLVVVANAAFLLWTVMLVLIVLDSVVLGTRLKKEVRRRFPDETTKGAVAYGLMRSTQLRRLRLPAPRVKPGAVV
ncbi:DUF3043 domain-containing protein [Vallicoccus soli]|uniref:DUF3043 domain-containing protein n=1 Tax=Vallicoccus soli TaxID=2339232 RepID=A0A3A3ZLU1_9ACTN|nr:DUF3043 domain-containing protein [Vallicoccus soli]